MESTSAGPTRRPRSTILRRALFVLFTVALLLGLAGVGLPGSTVVAQAPSTATPATPLPVQSATIAVDGPGIQRMMDAAQGAFDLLRSVVLDPSADPASIKTASDMLQQLEALLTQMHDVLASQPAAIWPALPGSPPAPAPATVAGPPVPPDPTGDLALLSQLAEITGQLELIVRELSEQTGPSVGAAAATPTAAASVAQSTPDPMAAMMQHMTDMMSMMGGMTGGSGQMGSSGAASGAAGAPVGAATPDASLRREAHTDASMIQVQPLNLGVPGMATLDFYMTFDSHGGNLDVNLPVSARLILPSGQELAPLRWVGPTSGQHVEGTLSFPIATENGAPAIPSAGWLRLIISSASVGGEQLFTWDLSLLH